MSFSTKTIVILLIATAFISPSLSAQTILRVNVNTPCPSGCDGSTWALAYPSLQTALTAFSSGEIWVAAGTYKPAGVGGSRTTSFDLKSNMSIYGGFNGTENSRSARNYTTNVTVLSGDLNGNDVGLTNNGENSYHVVTCYTKTGVVLDGFTIKNGNANNNAVTVDGGGVNGVHGQLTIQQCIFEYNYAKNGGGLQWGDSDAAQTSNLAVKDCTFRNNSGTYGAALGFAMYAGTTTAAIDNCLFENNQGVSGSYGGGIYAAVGAIDPATLNSSLKGCTFKTNFATYGGAINFNKQSSGVINNNVVNCPFVGNTANYGGAMSYLSGQHTFKNCLFAKNNATFGGAVQSPESAQFINCTFSGNGDVNSYGTCFRTATAATTLTNCILWNQTAPIDNTLAVVNYCDVQGGWATGTGNINVDPLFLDATNNNYNLKCTSPCKNVGDNTANAETTDLSGATRIQETTIDLGAYETDGVTLGVVITDNSFATAIRSACPTCINGSNVLLCAVLSQTSLNVSGQNISNLAGIELFTSLTSLNISNNNLTSFPTNLPSTLTTLNVSNNSLTTLPTSLPNSLTSLNLSNNSLTSLPTTLPSSLNTLNIANNSITCLPTLPNTLATFTFDAADINCLPNIPTALTTTMPVCATITTNPSVSGAVCSGGTVNLTATANSVSPMTVKWQRKGTADANYSDLAAAATYTTNTTATYNFSSSLADNGASYRAVFTPVCSGVTTTATQLTVINTSTAPATTTNNSLSFDGINDCVQIMNCSGTAFPFTDAITIEYWFKGSSIQSAVRFQPDASTYIVSGWTNKHIISTSSGTLGVVIGTGATDGNWHHVAMTWQKGVSSGFIAYLDGVKGATRTATNVNLPTMTSGLFLGANNGTSEFMNGSIDEVRIWNVARTAAQIAESVNISKCNLTLPQTGLVMYYRFNHGLADGSNTVNTLANTAQSSAYLGVLNNFNLSGTSSNFSSNIPGSCPTVLSVDLLDFKGTPQYNGNFLTWTTANEANNKGFYVERLMDNGQWIILGFVKSTSARLQTSPTLTTYNFTDNQPLTTSYYRLRQLDNDGTETLSKTISIATKSNNKLKVYPNPVSNLLTIETSETGDYQVFNLLGQRVLNSQKLLLGVSGLDVSTLPQGAYYLKIGEEQVKFVKQ
jgi:Concanavalin A-like lectin/glucanases superfamily/Secretion system C-terminal sorting domain